MILGWVVLGVLSSPDAAALGALLAALTAIVVAWRQGARAAGAATQAADLIATNGNLRPGEYLEMIGEIRGELRIVKGMVRSALDAVADHEASHH